MERTLKNVTYFRLTKSWQHLVALTMIFEKAKRATRQRQLLQSIGEFGKMLLRKAASPFRDTWRSASVSKFHLSRARLEARQCSLTSRNIHCYFCPRRVFGLCCFAFVCTAAQPACSTVPQTGTQLVSILRQGRMLRLGRRRPGRTDACKCFIAGTRHGGEYGFLIFTLSLSTADNIPFP